MSKGFSQTPRSLSFHPLWISAKHQWQLVFYWLLENAAYQDGIQPERVRQHNIHYQDYYQTINLMKGQVAFTFREIAKAKGISRDHVEGALKHFCGMNARGCLLPIIESKKAMPLLEKGVRLVENISVRQDKFFGKSIYNILLDGFYDKSKEQCPTYKNNLSPTSVRLQVRLTENSLVRQDPHSENKESVRLVENISVRQEVRLQELDDLKNRYKKPSSKVWDGPTEKEELVGGGLSSLGIDLDKQKTLLRKHGEEIVLKALQHVTSHEFTIETTAIQAITWACKAKPWEWKKEEQTPESRKSKFEQHFEDGKSYNGRLCEITRTGVCFYSGGQNPGHGVKFDDKMFFQKIGIVLKNLKIENPFIIDLDKTKEA